MQGWCLLKQDVRPLSPSTITDQSDSLGNECHAKAIFNPPHKISKIG